MPRNQVKGLPAPRMSLADFARMKASGQKIVMVTVYDAPSARLADAAGVDSVLVGDSAAMTVLGHDSTVPVTVDEMLMLTQAAARGARHAFLVADMPFGSFQPSNRAAVTNAVRFVKEGHADAVKVEGAGPTLKRVKAIVEAGIPVMGHVGLTPQSASMLGGYKAQGRTAEKAQRLLDEVVDLEKAGCFAIVLEAIPEPVAARMTAALRIPTIGIGAGASCDGQVLVWHDVLGISSGHVPQFVKRYADVGGLITSALTEYAADVRAARFPAGQHTYPMLPGEQERLDAADDRVSQSGPPSPRRTRTSGSANRFRLRGR